MHWQVGDRVIVRDAEWRVAGCTRFSDCDALDLEGQATLGARTLLVPFDRPRTPSRPRLAVVSRRRWAREVRDAVASSFPFGGLRHCPPTVRLLPYQLEPALALLRHGAARVLVADDVGLGKTVEAGLVIRELTSGNRHARVLVLCPASLGAQWAQEMARLFGIDVIRADAAWLRRMVREIPPDVNPWMLPGTYLASVDFVKRPEALRPLEDVRWDLLVVDEAHVATCGSDRRAAIDAIGDRADRLLLLTATPHSGDDDQFRALCALGRAAGDPLLIFARDRSGTPLEAPTLRSQVLSIRLSAEERLVLRLLGDYTRRLWAVSEQPGRRGAGLVATVLSKRALSSPAALAISLQRRRDLLAQVPGTPLQIQLPLDDPLQDETCDTILGERGLDHPDEEARILDGLIHRAAAVRAERKMQALLRLIRRIREPALIFSEYRDTAARLCQALVADGHDVALLHGGLAEGERIRAVARLAAGRAHLVATDAASEGLNLHHACRLVVHFELPWTPVRLHQRCGRVDRIGQTRRVHEVALVARETSEHLVIAPLLARAERSGSFARGRLMPRLAESQVAAHVLGGRPILSAACDLPAGTVRADFGDDARLEASRLELLRRLDITRPRLHRRRRAVVPIATIGGNVHVPRGLHLVFRVCVRPAIGPPLLQEIVVLTCDWRAPARGLRAADLRRQITDALDRAGGIHTTIDRLAAERAAAVQPRHDAAIRRLHRRAAFAKTRLGSAAEQLVQAGLFDRRALRARAARRQALEICGVHDSSSGVREHGQLETSRELLAILVGSDP